MSSNIRLQRICQHCGNEFTAKTTVTKYCSDKCAKRAYKARKRAEKVTIAKKETKEIKLQPINKINAKPFLTIGESCQLLGVSRSTLYRMNKQGLLLVGQIGRRKIIRRSDIEAFFEQKVTLKWQKEKELNISDCYNIGEVQQKFNISEKTLFDLIKRKQIPKIKKGKFTYVPKQLIENLLT